MTALDISLFHETEFNRRKMGLSTLFSVSIAGCDLLGSTLYTAGTCAASSGKVVDIIVYPYFLKLKLVSYTYIKLIFPQLSPVGLLLVTTLLFFFRRIYSEVVTAIPNNVRNYHS